MNLIQDAHEKGEKSDQPHVSKLLVSLAGQALITTVQGIFSAVVLFSVVFASRMELSVQPRICQPLFVYAGTAQGTALLLCSLARQLSGCSVNICISGMNAQHVILGCEARNYSSLASGRL